MDRGYPRSFQPAQLAPHRRDADAAIAANHDGRGHTDQLKQALDSPFRIQQHREREIALLHEGSDVTAGPAEVIGLAKAGIDTHCDNLEAVVSELSVQPLERRHLGDTWNTPRGPHVQQNDLAAQCVE